MPAKIIVSYDGTANEDDAIALGRLLAAAGGEVSLAYVRHTQEPDRDRETLAEAEGQELLLVLFVDRGRRRGWPKSIRSSHRGMQMRWRRYCNPCRRRRWTCRSTKQSSPSRRRRRKARGQQASCRP